MIVSANGYWQPVCGGIENGESAYEAAIREVNEEAGITNYEWIDMVDVSKLTDWMPIVSVCEYLTRKYSAIEDQPNS